jgi:hypothetical protein
LVIPKTHGGFEVSKTRWGSFVPKSRRGFYLKSEVVYLFWGFGDISGGCVPGEYMGVFPIGQGQGHKGLHLENKFKAFGFLGSSVL